MDGITIFVVMMLVGLFGYSLGMTESQDVKNISMEVVGTVIEIRKDMVLFMNEDGVLLYCQAKMDVVAKGKRYRFYSPCMKNGCLFYKDATPL